MLNVQQCLVKNSMTPVLHPPYLPDLSASDFLLFPWVKNILKRKPFADVEEVNQKTAEALKGIKIDEFKNCFWQCKKVSIGVSSNGEYFEGD